MKVNITLFNDDGDEEDVEFPARNEVCPDCDGEGSTYLGWAARDQPAFTAEDFREEGPDFREDYISGAYDRACPNCKGKRVVKVVWEEYCSPELLARLDKHNEDQIAFEAERRAERRSGC